MKWTDSTLVEDGHGQRVAECDIDSRSAREVVANAALIVRAVNAHDEAVALLREMIDDYEAEEGCVCARCKALPRVRALLQRIDGGQP